MSNGDLIAIDGIGYVEPTLIGRQMRNDLVAKEIKIDPFGRASAFGAAQKFTMNDSGDSGVSGDSGSHFASAQAVASEASESKPPP